MNQDQLLRAIERCNEEIAAAIAFGRNATTEADQICSSIWEMDWRLNKERLIAELETSLAVAA